MFGDLRQDQIPEWEYPIREAWQQFDPLGFGRVPGWIVVPEASEQRAAGWRRLPPLLRAIAWREREIAVFLYAVLGELQWYERLPQLRAVGVVSLPSFRRFGHILAGALFVEAPFDIYPDEVYRQLGLAPTVGIDTRVDPPEAYGIERETPIVVLRAQTFMLYSAAPAVTLQSGISVEGNHVGNQFVRGTLTAIAEDNKKPVIVGAYHVFGDPYKTITVNGQPIAEVIQTVPALDAAIAEPLDPAINLNDTVSALGRRPAAPVLPCTGIPVQYEGARSQRQIAHTIDTAYYASPPIPGSPLPTGSPLFAVTIPAVQGDSGALLTTQAGNVPQRYLRQNPQLAALYDGAMAGMLVAGPDPPAPGPQTILFCPIVDIGDQLNLDWLTI